MPGMKEDDNDDTTPGMKKDDKNNVTLRVTEYEHHE